MIIVDEIKNTHPRREVCFWIESRSHGRYIMLVTMIGIVITVLFSIGSVLIGAFQVSSQQHL